MGRANAIVVGSAVLAPLILGVEGFALFRPHHRPAPPSEMADLPAAAAPAPAPLPAPPPVVPPPAQRAAAPPTAPATKEPEPAAALEPAEAPRDPATLTRWRDLMRQRGQLVRDADEKAFDALNLPDGQRAAIRAIDDQYARTLQSMEASGGLAPDADLNANQTRRAAITEVLGTDGIHAFTFQERKAERRVHAQQRAESLHGP